MTIQPGDRVSLSLSPIISLSTYINLKPHASVSRDVPEGADPVAFIEQLTADVREVCYNALAADLDVMNELSQALAEGADLATILKEKIGHVPPRTVSETPARSAGGPRKKIRSA